MRILFIGDVVGRSGREALLEHLPRLKQKLATDVVIVNGENAAHGFGINDKICLEMFAAGVDDLDSCAKGTGSIALFACEV